MEYQKILITGAAGFIGHALTKSLIADGYLIYGIDNINNYYDVKLKYDRLANLGIQQKEAEKWNKACSSSSFKNFQFGRLDVADRTRLPKLFKEQNFDAVIHLAAQAGVRYSIENPETYIDSNIVGFLNILECCRHHGIKHLVYASSSSVYGTNDKIPFSEDDRVDFPISLYAATKKSNELMAYTYSHLYRIPTSGLRFFTVYGPWGRPDMAPMIFASAIDQNKPINVFNHGKMSRDFTFIDDIIQGILLTLKNPPTEETDQAFYQIFNIGNGAPVNLLDFINTLESALNKKAQKKMLGMQPGDVPRTWAKTKKLNALNYKSNTNIQEGIKEFTKWFTAYHQEET